MIRYQSKAGSIIDKLAKFAPVLLQHAAKKGIYLPFVSAAPEMLRRIPSLTRVR
jgi:hypothetical protein